MDILTAIWVAAIIAIAASLLMNAWLINIMLKSSELTKEFTQEKKLLNEGITKLMTSEVQTQREKKAGWHKWTKIEYMEIKSPVIKRDCDSRGFNTTMFANGVLIARRPGTGADVKMDS